MSVNTKIKQLMKEQGVTQNALAQKLGITQAALSNMLSGDNQIRRRTLDKIAAALGRTAEFFLEDKIVDELSGRIEELERDIKPFKMPDNLLKCSMRPDLSKKMSKVSNKPCACKNVSADAARTQLPDNYQGQDMTGFFYTLLQKALSRIDKLEKEVSALKDKKQK